MSNKIVWKQTGTPIPRARTPWSCAPGYYLNDAGSCTPVVPQTEPNKPD